MYSNIEAQLHLWLQGKRRWLTPPGDPLGWMAHTSLADYGQVCERDGANLDVPKEDEVAASQI
jgi:hypothetical protein